MSDRCRSCQAPMPCRCCRLYRGRLNRGYGVVDFGEKRYSPNGRYRGRRQVFLHRWVMEQLLGRRLRPDEEVMHACDQPACFFIDHLSVGTHAENMADMRTKDRAHKPASIAINIRVCPACDSTFLAKGKRLDRRCCSTACAQRIRVLAMLEAKGLRPLTEVDVREIRSLLAAGLSQSAAARQFGVSHATVNYIARGRTWSHVGM